MIVLKRQLHSFCQIFFFFAKVSRKNKIFYRNEFLLAKEEKSYIIILLQGGNILKSEAKRICSELKMLKNKGIHASRELLMTLASKGTYWYIVFANTKDFSSSMDELFAEAC